MRLRPLACLLLAACSPTGQAADGGTAGGSPTGGGESSPGGGTAGGAAGGTAGGSATGGGTAGGSATGGGAGGGTSAVDAGLVPPACAGARRLTLARQGYVAYATVTLGTPPQTGSGAFLVDFATSTSQVDLA